MPSFKERFRPSRKYRKPKENISEGNATTTGIEENPNQTGKPDAEHSKSNFYFLYFITETQIEPII